MDFKDWMYLSEVKYDTDKHYTKNGIVYQKGTDKRLGTKDDGPIPSFTMDKKKDKEDEPSSKQKKKEVPEPKKDSTPKKEPERDSDRSGFGIIENGSFGVEL